MKRKTMLAVCCVLILCALTGCQLAKESAGANTNEDRMIGVLITTECLDLFDFEGYLNANINSIQGDKITVDRNTQEYQGRLYAVLVLKTLTNEKTGETIATHEYVFEGIEGMPFFYATVPAMSGNKSYETIISDPAISDGHTSIFTSDDENRVSIDGTIYVAPMSTIHTYYFNPVYQSADGSVYVISGNAFSVNTEKYSEGSVCSYTLDTTTTINENGKVKKGSISVKISVSVMFAPEKIIVLQMGSDNALVSRTEYKPDAMPKELKLETSTTYFIVETHKRDDKGNMIISREIYGRDVENIETFFVRTDGVCVKHWTRIVGK